MGEVTMLKLLRKVDRHNKGNIVHMKEHFCEEDQLLITFELMGWVQKILLYIIIHQTLYR